MSGKFLVIEGPDGSGKSTLLRSLSKELKTLGLPFQTFREPGGCPLSEEVRSILQNPELPIGSRAETLLFLAARAQLCEDRILPALQKGDWVLLDRWEESTLVYQGEMRGLGRDMALNLSSFARGDLRPDRVLLLTLSADDSRKRRQGRGEDDRIEEELAGKEERIISAYNKLGKRDPKLYRIIDASRSPEEVFEQAQTELRDLLLTAS